MSEEPTASDAASGPGGQPSEEELREYLSKLRTVPADRAVLDAVTSVLTAAQAKLGRRDGRLMIDLGAIMLDHTRAHLPEQQSQQFDQVISQLRLAQLQTEQQVAQRGTDEPNDLASAPAPPSTSGPGPAAPAQPQPAPQPAQPQQPPPASKLWVPGRP